MSDLLAVPAETFTGARRVGIVVGSTRPKRICGDIATWARDILRAGSELHYELIDLAEIDLPFLDEPLKPALGNYAHEHTRAWSRLVSSFDAFVFVFPQYNWGYPAPLKNAIDFLYSEWHDRPVGLVTYGTRGGGRGAAQLRGVLEGVHMRVLESGVELRISDADVDQQERLLDLDATLNPYRSAVRALDDQLAEALIDDQANAVHSRPSA